MRPSASPWRRPTSIAEPTGAGDGYRGGFFAAWAAGLPLGICGRVGALCSTYVLEQVGTSSHRFSMSEFITRYEENFGAEPSLTELAVRRPQTADEYPNTQYLT
jgi:adenosine kinase